MRTVRAPSPRVRRRSKFKRLKSFPSIVIRQYIIIRNGNAQMGRIEAAKLAIHLGKVILK